MNLIPYLRRTVLFPRIVMDVGDKIIIKKSLSLLNMKGKIVSSIPGTNPTTYIVKIDYHTPLILAFQESEFSRRSGQEFVVLTKGDFCLEEGSDGKIVHILPRKRYLCEFHGPFCNIELGEDEIMPWNPETGVFAVLNTVRVVKDLPEHHLKKGMEGVIVVVFFTPHLAYDVEFYLGETVEPNFEVYTLLPHQIELVDVKEE
jgi:hypothetical protein